MKSKTVNNGVVPKLRFPEFRKAGEWTERALESISPSIFDGTHQTPNYVKTGVPFFSVENLISGAANKFISKEDYKTQTKKNKPQKNDLLITRIGKIGYSQVVNWDYEFSIYVTLAVISQSTQFNSNYLNFYFQSESYQKEIMSKSLLNAVPCKINMDALRKTLVLLPKPAEQQKIADCLTFLDNLITAESRKLGALKDHKKGVMQNLFPVEGETGPKVRFPEFRDAWEFQKLSKIYTFISNNTFSRDNLNYVNGFVKNIHYGDIHKKFDTLFDISKMKIPFVNKDIDLSNIENSSFCLEGDMIFADASEDLKDVGKSIEIVNLNREKVLSGSHTILARQNSSKIIIGFAGHLFKCNKIRAQIQKEAQGTKVFSISTGRLSNIEIYFPKNKTEQQKIATCLSSLDNLISAQTQKINALKSHKKGLMQQLFPFANEVN